MYVFGSTEPCSVLSTTLSYICVATIHLSPAVASEVSLRSTVTILQCFYCGITENGNGCCQETFIINEQLL